MNYKKFCLGLLLSGISIYSRTFHGPLHFIDTHSKFNLPLINENEYNQDIFKGEIRPMVGFYYRHADRAFGSSLSNCATNYSSLFHGKENFKISELFENSRLPIVLDNNTQNDMYVDGKMSPRYCYSENGAYVGVDVSKVGCGECDDIRMQMKVRLPIKNISIKNKKGWDSLRVDTAADGSALIDPRVQLNQELKTFAAPLDWLANEGIIAKKPLDQRLYMVDTVQIGAADVNDTTATDIVVSYDSITKGGMGSADIPPALINSALYVKSGNGAFNVLDDQSNGANSDALYVPLQLITKVDKGTENLYFNDLPLFVEPNPLYPMFTMEAPKGATSNSSNFWQGIYSTTEARDFSGITTNNIQKTANVNALNASLEAYSSGELELKNMIIVATKNPSQDIVFTVPPVIIQPVDSQNPLNPQLASNTFFSDTDNIKGSGVSGTDDISLLSPENLFPFIQADDKNTNFDNATIEANNAEGAFWFEADYKNTDLSANNTLYVISSLDANNNNTPTSASVALYEYLKNLKSPTYEKEELIKDLSGYAHLGIKKNFYDSYCNSGLGDLDVEFSVGKNFCDNKFEGDISAGIVFPTASSKRDRVNYLYESLGNEGHFEGRVSAQGLYHACDWINLIGYASFTHVFGAHEYMINAFKNSKAFGLQPANTLVNVSWNQMTASLDMAMNWCDIGFNLGYQFVNKFKDSYELCKITGRNAVAEYQNLSFSQQKCLSERQMHKVRASIASAYSDHVSFEVGFLETFAGKNTAKDHEYFVRFMYLF